MTVTPTDAVEQEPQASTISPATATSLAQAETADETADVKDPKTPTARIRKLEDGRSFQVVSFRLGGEEYGIDIMIVQEIILLGRITQVPEVPDHVLGVINLRGNVIPIVNLRSRFGMPSEAPTDETRIVVANVAGRTFGMVVDGVNEVLRLSRDDVSTTPQSVTEGGRDYVQGLARREDRLLILLDMGRLLQARDLPTNSPANDR